ncbi:MAG: ribose 5-phosphate isomerase A [Thermoleophilia bacterium]
MSDTAHRIRAWDAAGQAAAQLVRPGDRVGLGTGRAAAAGIRALGRRVEAGLRCTGVPTGAASTALAREAGIPVARLREPLAVAFDGADIVLPSGLAIKGAGGAMVRERLVAGRAARFVVLIDEPKLGGHLDEWGVLPVAVVPFAAALARDALADLTPTRRPSRSDDGLVLLDLHPAPGGDWEALDARVRAVPGVVDTGLFRLVPGDVFVGMPDGSVRTLGGA